MTRFATAAQIPNATAIPTRAEEHATTEAAGTYDVVTARALASLPVLAEYAAPLLRGGGHLIAWKGKPEPEEETAGAKAAEILGLTPCDLVVVRPFEGSRERRLYVYEKTGDTPERFPRRVGVAAKRPLA